eukprot:CAMPEP_0119498852 /NCGR_PEP_ID=MMETSP1344-20130328/21499_1 /TAXON_ID=236787 /ORGANISM="Florenciella parvula, Strain CCMP2471" /LENGTH=53 /DNA_ID=CAMNT_0007534787 /DNA_START=20 /DNA_END=178 /DNA_ORIENTATION=+
MLRIKEGVGASAAAVEAAQRTAEKAENNKQLLEQFHRDTVTRVRAGVDVGASA